MKKTNFTFLKKQAFRLLFGSLFLCTMALSSYGQCTLACNGMTNVSLDNSVSNCMAQITVGMVADTSGCVGGGPFTVSVFDEAGVEIPDALVSSAYIGQILEVVVTDGTSNNSCWGNLIVEDKLPPVIDCNQTVANVYCFELENFEPTATDNCDTDLDIVLIDQVEVINDCSNPNVSDDVLKTVTRTYVAIDDQGLVSNECEFEFTVLRLESLTDVDEPSNLLLNDNTHLECDEAFHTLPNGNPSPLDTIINPGLSNEVIIEGTGVPTIEDLAGNDVALYPNAYQACNILVTFTDTDLPPIGCAKKIMRTWSILEWSCSEEQRSYEFIQMIEIVDNEGPSITCPSDMTLSTNGSSCLSTMILPPAEASDNCSDASELTYTVSYGSGPVLFTNGGLAQMPEGNNTVTYTVYDACLNSNSCTINVYVEDQTPPVVICDQNTTVALTTDGCAYVHASVFDDGSYDECSDISLSVRRMDAGETCETGTACTDEDDDNFDEYVRFCCADQGQDIMVVLKVVDGNGNENVCMVNVEVQDKLAPTIVCPLPMTVNCDFAFDEDNLGAFFGEATVFDNCADQEPLDVINTDGLNQCNIGTAVRTISVGTAGTANYAVCTQQIVFTATELFNGGVPDYIEDTDITWPLDVTMEGCDDPDNPAYLPENLEVGHQFPTYTEGACDLVGANYEDQVFPFNDENGDACFKIVRRWTVIDWCQFVNDNGSTYYPTWTHTQIIKVNDNVGPTDIVTTGESSVCTYDSDCADGYIDLGASSSDICTELLDWSYTIFTDGQDDGKLDDVLYLNGVAQSFNGYNANSIDASGIYPIGTHKVLYTFSDKCGNVTSTEFEFSIVNCKAPTAYCHNGLAVELSPDDNGGASAQMWATDLDAGSSHSCPGYTVYISFDSIVVSETGNVDAGNGIKINVNNGRVFDCDDLGDNFVDVWAGIVTSEGNIAQSFCTATLNVQDNMGACSGAEMRIAGEISTASDVYLENAEVKLLGSEAGIEMTDDLGTYAFPLMPMGGTYSIAPLKNDDYTNGVTTLDLVMIQRHILGLAEFDDVYKVIAADINNDEAISATDLIQLRKLILGSIIELPENGSWRFIDAAFEIDVEDPFIETLPESYDIASLDSDMNVNFVAVKVGDVNNDATANLTEGTVTNRSNNTVSLRTEALNFDAGESITVPLKVEDAISVTGMQFTIETGRKLDFAGITSSTLNISDQNVGFSNMSEGLISISWNNATGVEVEGTIIELVFNASENGSISEELDITSTILNAEVYNENLETSDVEFVIEGREVVVEGEFVLYQNTPNPFAETTDISFELPSKESGVLTVYDVTGKVVTRIQKTFDKGYNQITLERADLGAAGVLYYQLEAGAYNASRTMIMID